jgi:nucleotide-binding universal stress UspA family protein
MGTHGRGGFEHLVLGSVTEKVLRKADCPVLIVPPAVARPAGPIQFDRILCPLDFGPVSAMALRHAVAMARETGAHLTVLHVLEPLEDEPRVVPVAVPEYRRLREEQAREDLHRALSAEEHADTVGMLAPGKPYREIVRVARETSADLILMGVAGGGTLRRLFLGSTTNHVVREATCPVLTMRAPQLADHTFSEELVETART